VLVLLVALAAQMALPALHAWRSGETASTSPAALASRTAAETAGPAFSHAVPIAGTHDPATCAVCQLLHNASRAAPTPASFAWALVAGEAILTAPTPHTLDRAGQGNHPPRAPPV
jgi:hypothetical protein